MNLLHLLHRVFAHSPGLISHQEPSSFRPHLKRFRILISKQFGIEVERVDRRSEFVFFDEFDEAFYVVAIEMSNHERECEGEPEFRNEGELGEDRARSIREVGLSLCGIVAEGSEDMFEDGGNCFVGEVRDHFWRVGLNEEGRKRGGL